MFRQSKKISILSLVLMAALMIPAAVQAREVKYPVAAYTAEELAEVREWEKTWAGKKIDKTNIDQIAEFFPESYVRAFKNPVKWGAPPDDWYFVIIPYKQAIETKGMIAATKKYAPQVKMNADGWIENYADIAGIPFPAPKTGQEIAWNFDFNTRGDANHYWAYGPVIAPASSIERYMKSERWELFWIHRVDVEPLPKYDKNKKGIHRGMFQHMYEPSESMNTRYFSLTYISPDKSEDTYMFYAPFRRIRRIAVGQRTDAIDGSDMIYDDQYGWDGHITRNTYKYVGTKELLCMRQADLKRHIRQPGQALPSNMQFERLKTLVVEVYSKDPNYIYSKRIWYMDPETYMIPWTDLYDDLGKFWKTFLLPHTDFKTMKGETKKMISGLLTLDFQRNHAGIMWEEWIGVGLKKVDRKLFTIQNLQKTY